MEKYGFVYIWRDRKDNRYYVGCHWGAEDDGYVCSSKWMKSAFKRRPEDFKRRILSRNLDKKTMYNEEQKWLDLIKSEELGHHYYNLKINIQHWCGCDGVITIGKTISEALSKTKKGNVYTKGRIWITNHVISKMIKKDQSIPEGWSRGREDEAKKQMANSKKGNTNASGNKGMIWITRDTSHKKIRKEEIIPDGWRPGRK